jgi:hypothetical protein
MQQLFIWLYSERILAYGAQKKMWQENRGIFLGENAGEVTSRFCLQSIF